MLDGIRNAVIIFNPAAGRLRGRSIGQLLETVGIFHAAGIEAELRATDAPGSATTLAQAAVRQGRHLVISCGGDGTLNEVVNGLAGSSVPLGVLPAGTANVLGKELRLSWSLPEAARQLIAGESRRIALGRVELNGGTTRYFITLAGCGVDADMVYRVSDRLKKWTGKGAYWVAGFQQLVAYRYPRFRMTTGELQVDAAFLCIGRTKAHGFPVNITTGADLFENLFELAAFTYDNSGGLMASGLAAFLGRLRHARNVQFWKTDAVRCEPLNEARIHVQADGELLGALPAAFQIVPDALTLVVPKS